MILRPASNVVRVSRRPSRLVAVVLVAAAVTAGCSASSTTTVTGTGPGPIKCGVSLADPSVVDAGGGAARLSIATQPECAWTVSSAVNWISGLSPASGQGSGDVEFRVTPNDGSSAREGDIVVNESRVRVSQRAPCRYNVSPQNQSVNAGADAGGVTVATQSECGWTATTDVGWINLSSPLSGNGNGSVSFTVSSNGGAERTGSIVIAGQSSVVTQARLRRHKLRLHASCSCSGSGSGSRSGCSCSRSGSYSCSYSLLRLPLLLRSAPTPACNYSISPDDQKVEERAGTRTVRVSTTNACSWTASSNASWITVTSGATGTGDGSVAFSYAANTGALRTGTLTIAGQTFTLTQAPCAYSISPDTVKIDGDGGTATISVSTGSTCTWTASSNESWITITAGASGMGNGTVRFTVARNNGRNKRTATLTIAGRNAKVEQEDD